ncbi:SR-related and CTD-associated factor 4-like [Esox lucius]|uniref:SR-related and CTD-associated factor 4-like n=1 Tax=Esox lucius TaxID=8010 RepID=UPI0009732B3E|nr:SR-related and CTD-associated factor 4-like [Esox lucius]
MDAVNAFNLELFSMIDMKPPISRAKMMSVTKSAIKAIKLYKHVVQIVEKFIKKCKPELKVPGLYVMDSIVRQSRHQFGVDKDVYGPRFQKNFTPTFQNLYLCPHDDKSKIIRVLNLWQKNSVFEMNVVQPLLDMATGSFVPVPSPQADRQAAAQHESQPQAAGQLEAQHQAAAQHQAQPQAATQLLTTSASIAAALPQLPPQLQNPEALAAVAQLFQSGQGHELQKLLQNFQMGQQMPPAASNIVVTHPQVNQDPLNTHLPVFDPPPTQPLEQNNLLAKKLLDRFDYDDEPEEVKKDEISSVGQGNPYGQFPGTVPTAVEHQFQGHIIPGLAGAPQTAGVGYSSLNEGYAQNQGNSREREDPSGRREGRQRGSGHARRSRSRSGSRSPRKRRSRSGSRSRRPRNSSRRSGSCSRESRWSSPRSRSQERKERETDKERRQKGLPSIKSQTLSVCTTTLWVGQLDKKTNQQDVMSLLEEFGQIDSINMIPPRGCAYIVMVHRQDAYRALHKLSRGSFKVNQKAIKIAWALNKGIKVTHKKFWDVERGVTYIPWSKVKVEELEGYREGGMLDADTLCPEWGEKVKELTKPGGLNNGEVDSMQMEGAGSAHVQVPSAQAGGTMGSPPGFPGSMGLPPPSLSPGGPSSFMPTGFNPTQMPPGFHPPVVGGPGCTKEEQLSKDKPRGSGSSSDSGSDNQQGAPGPSGPGPVMSPPGPAGLMPPRPGMPMGPSQGPPPPHLQPHFPPHMPPPNMPPMMMGPRGPGPMFHPRGGPLGGFRMPMGHPPMEDFPSYGPHGPNFQPGPPGMEEEGGWEDRRHFRGERSGFGGRGMGRGGFGERGGPFPRGGGNDWSRDGPEGRGRFMNRRDRYERC